MIPLYVCGLRGAVVSVVAFKAKGRGFKSTHGCSHIVPKPSISPALFGQCTLNIYLPLMHSPLNFVCFLTALGMNLENTIMKQMAE